MECSGNTLPRPCAEKFEEMSRALGKIDQMARDVEILRRAVVGNGNARDSLAFRVRRIEECNDLAGSNRRKWGDRLWRMAIAIGLVLLGWWIKE